MRGLLFLIVLFLCGEPLHSAVVETVFGLTHADAKNEWIISSALETDFVQATMTRAEGEFSVTSIRFQPTAHLSIGRLVYRGIAARVRRYYRPMKPSIYVLRGIIPSRSHAYMKSIQPQELLSEGALLAVTEQDRYGLSAWYLPQASKVSATPEAGLHVTYGNSELVLLQKQGGNEGAEKSDKTGYTAVGYQLKAHSTSLVQSAVTMGLRRFPTLPASCFTQINLKCSFGRFTAGIRRTCIEKHMYPGTTRWQQLKEAVTAAGSIDLGSGVDIFAVYQRIGFWDSFRRAERTIHTAINWKLPGGNVFLSSQYIENHQAEGKFERSFQYEGKLQIVAGALEVNTGRRLLWENKRWQTEVDFEITAKVASSECTLSINWSRGENRPELSTAIQVVLSEGVQIDVSRKQQESVALLKLQSL